MTPVGDIIKFLVVPQGHVVPDVFESIDNFLADDIDFCRMQGQTVLEGITPQVGVDHGVDGADFGHGAVDDEKFRAIFQKDAGHIPFLQAL